NVFVFYLTVVLMSACGPKYENKHLTYQNIVILSDLSSRLDKRPQKDTNEIFRIVSYFKSECVKPGEKIGDKSSISFSALSDTVAASIEINQIKTLADKQGFINSTDKYEKNGLEQKLKEFKNAVTSVYNTIRNPGLDLISM